MGRELAKTAEEESVLRVRVMGSGKVEGKMIKRTISDCAFSMSDMGCRSCAAIVKIIIIISVLRSFVSFGVQFEYNRVPLQLLVNGCGAYDAPFACILLHGCPAHVRSPP
ncbi:hypothetical protein TRVL_00976 [Trypanosoma vivax]|nr:hypothetical protein TRVL_00976 [Trypanosoma vivax]